MAARGSKTVLIVDDVPFVRTTLREILTSAGHRVVGEAADGAAAIKLYAELQPDIVTMDVVMPQMSGLDAARTIIRMDRDARVIVISAMGQENLVMEAINVGAKDYVLKPFSASDVLKAVDRAFADETSPRAPHAS